MGRGGAAPKWRRTARSVAGRGQPCKWGESNYAFCGAGQANSGANRYCCDERRGDGQTRGVLGSEQIFAGRKQLTSVRRSAKKSRCTDICSKIKKGESLRNREISLQSKLRPQHNRQRDEADGSHGSGSLVVDAFLSPKSENRRPTGRSGSATLLEQSVRSLNRQSSQPVCGDGRSGKCHRRADDNSGKERIAKHLLSLECARTMLCSTLLVRVPNARRIRHLLRDPL